MLIQTPSQPDQAAPILSLVKHSVLFKNLEPAALNAISVAGTLQQYRKDSYLFHEGDPAKNISILIQGVMHLSQLTPKGQQVIMHYLSPGDEIGILALFPDQVYPVTAVAATDCMILTWSSSTLASLIKQFPQLALNALQMMTERFIVLQNQYRQLATERVEQRIARTILKIAEKTGKIGKNGVRLSPPPSRQQIAEMTGTTLYTVSRICSQWEKDGLVKTNRRWLLLKNERALQKIAEDEFTALSSPAQKYN